MTQERTTRPYELGIDINVEDLTGQDDLEIPTINLVPSSRPYGEVIESTGRTAHTGLPKSHRAQSYALRYRWKELNRGRVLNIESIFSRAQIGRSR